MIRLQNLLFGLVLLFLFGCNRPEPTEVQKLSPEVAFDSLATYLERSGDYINSPNVPALISASELYNELDSNILLIDIREPNDFADAHIKGAKNIPFSQVLNYFEYQIDPNSFTKIVMICYSGQVSSYATAILRLLGYQNVLNLRWGMSSWHRPTAEEFWLARISGKYSEFLGKTANQKKTAGSYPGIETEKNFGYSKLHERAEKLFAEGFDSVRVSIDELYKPNHNFYIIN